MDRKTEHKLTKATQVVVQATLHFVRTPYHNEMWSAMDLIYDLISITVKCGTSMVSFDKTG